MLGHIKPSIFTRGFNPETISTDYDTADRLYFASLTEEDVLEVLSKDYHQKNKSEINDAEYDELKQKSAEIEIQLPEIYAIRKGVGAPPDESFSKMEHQDLKALRKRATKPFEKNFDTKIKILFSAKTNEKAVKL
ncbi:Carbamoyl-phosphate synthetase ammonia chain [Dirofilaria immitis]|nr:Carbamoyl-phosphate synthetase ammonia chain [Dirofilaria immitis]